jgi:hypothetical protein
VYLLCTRKCENFPRGHRGPKQMRIVQENELDNPTRFVIID